MSIIAVIGAGSWGTALAHALAHSGHEVRLWAYEPEVVASLRERRENTLFLPGVAIPGNVAPTGDLGEALAGAECALTVMPSHVCRGLYERMLPHLSADMPLVSATKGIDTERRQRMSQVIRDVTAKAFSPRPPRVVVLSGPSFAREVAVGDPTALVAASTDADAAQWVQRAFSGKTMRVYASGDVVGVEIGGAIKNVIAIAAGVIEGLRLGHNPKAALITRGLAEIARLATALGARRETLAGLAGMGDLILTCTGDLSRNRSVGVELGRGRDLQGILSSMREVAEGVKTTYATVELARELKVEMPITEQVRRILEGEVAPREAIRELMDRSLKAE
ncbi:MAG: NAD(P)-dependent glycerol-3-phosphate dehydrogenase [Acidobacteriota bacterium]|jgi:glycerol-3-phosphate dehydrogenase (NAD(P)+)|nr:NAD(P)-dependent glycerol-3-phosphate dehydrogenase [Acidobacteriota bacterium]